MRLRGVCCRAGRASRHRGRRDAIRGGVASTATHTRCTSTRLERRFDEPRPDASDYCNHAKNEVSIRGPDVRTVNVTGLRPAAGTRYPSTAMQPRYHRRDPAQHTQHVCKAGHDLRAVRRHGVVPQRESVPRQQPSTRPHRWRRQEARRGPRVSQVRTSPLKITSRAPSWPSFVCKQEIKRTYFIIFKLSMTVLYWLKFLPNLISFHF